MTTENSALAERVATLEDVADLKLYVAENFARLKTLLHRNQAETILWMVGTMLAVAALAVAAIKLLRAPLPGKQEPHRCGHHAGAGARSRTAASPHCQTGGRAQCNQPGCRPT